MRPERQIKHLRKYRRNQSAPRHLPKGCDSYVTVSCRSCDTGYWVPVLMKNYVAHQRRVMLVQEAFPHLHPKARELMTQNRQCNRCWNQIFGPGPMAPRWRRWVHSLRSGLPGKR